MQAAAVAAKATHLVTNNLDDVPATKMPNGFLAMSPDMFAVGLTDQDIETMLGVVETQAGQRRTRP